MGRPEVAQKVIDIFIQTVDRQGKKGLIKYGTTIDTATGYNWDRMALEECVDCMQYMVKQIRELEAENAKLRKALQDKGFEDF